MNFDKCKTQSKLLGFAIWMPIEFTRCDANDKVLFKFKVFETSV